MSYYGYFIDSDSDIAHHGVKGMKWGIRKNPIYNQAYNYFAARDLKRSSVKKTKETLGKIRNASGIKNKTKYAGDLYKATRDSAVAFSPMSFKGKARYSKRSEFGKNATLAALPLLAARPMSTGLNAGKNLIQDSTELHYRKRLKKEQKSQKL